MHADHRPTRIALTPAFSLFRAPVTLRLAGTAALLAALWAGVWWAAV